MNDFWPENVTDDTSTTPISIMREQADLLGHKTKNLVVAGIGIGETQNDKFAYYFYIIAPTLNNYHFLLFKVEHEIEIYPLTIYLDEVLGEELGIAPLITKTTSQAAAISAFVQSIAPQTAQSSARRILTISSEKELMDALRLILSSQRSQQVIKSLLSIVNTTYKPHPV